MLIISIIYAVFGSLMFAFGICFSIFCIKENRIEAFLRSVGITLIFGICWFAIFYFKLDSLMIITLSILIVFLLLFFLPIGERKDLKIIAGFGKADRVDERDTMFARSYLKIGSDEYEKYYQVHPERKPVDDKIRALPELLEPGGKYYDEYRSTYVDSLFKIERSRINEVDGDVNPKKKNITPEEATKLIKEFTLHLGADEVGIAKLNPNYIYSHSAIGPEKWGSEIENNHEYVIAFTLEMDYYKVEEAPKIGITEESADKYLQAQEISIALAKFIRDMGYPARAHISGSNYQIMLPPVGYDAGLGELGRMNYLISKKFGARIRLGAVTTDLPLIPDKPIYLGVQDFCEKCNKCAVNCPSGAIGKGEKNEIRGVEKWELNVEQCYRYWRILGTDCGLCMKVCPFSHPNNFVHNIIRMGIRNSAFARKVSVWGDDLIYGK
jgi:reductive dehalogenase